MGLQKHVVLYQCHPRAHVSHGFRVIVPLGVRGFRV